jgi:monooxygenase
VVFARGSRAVAAGGAAVRDDLDVLIVGAGLAGIGAAHQLQSAFPGLDYAILESRDALGGTWDLFRYPGVRSDSDMFTMAYRFRPWPGAQSFAGGPAIRDYVRATAEDAGIDRRIRYRHRVLSASWSSDEARWTVLAEHDGEQVRLTAKFLHLCAGYYHYEQPHAPEFPGVERFTGTVVHPQHWPEDLAHAGKRVVVIGSGATAITLVPAMADDAAHVTMLQRSPSYVVSVPGQDPLLAHLRGRLGERATYALVRWKNILYSAGSYRFSRAFPKRMSEAIRKAAAERLPAGYDVDTHFNPSYDPWDQRMCLAPDGDLFDALSSGRASVVTDHVEEFTETGIRLRSGAELDADIVITATGLRLRPFGGITFTVDGREVAPSETTVYKGAMLSGIPNLAFTFGYTNHSWTLKADLVGEFVVRLLRQMRRNGHDRCVPVKASRGAQPMIENFTSHYVQRGIDAFPRSDVKAPWRVKMDYFHDLLVLRHLPVGDRNLRFSRSQSHAMPSPSLSNVDE